jgi:osomolarity two-component system response regulator SKN7
MPPPPTRPDTRGAVKLEDLVSSDRRQAQHGQAQAGPGGLTSAPLNVSMHDPNRPPGSSHDLTPGTGAAQGGGGDGQAGGSGPQQQPGPSEFIKKLYKMLEEESATFGKGRSAKGGEPKRGSVGWGRGGTSFVVWDMNDFTTKVL